jgi:hypothetical protein
MLEKDIERKACEWAKSQGWLVYKFTSPNRRSVPDRLFIREGRVVFIEFKRPGGRLTEMQRREIRKLQLHGIKAEVAYSVEDAQWQLQSRM